MSKSIEWIADIEEMSYEQMRIEFMRFSRTYQLINDLQDHPVSYFQQYLKAMHSALPLNLRRNLYEKSTHKFSKNQLNTLESLFDSAEHAHSYYEDINMPYEKWWNIRGHLVFDSVSNTSFIKDLGTFDRLNGDQSSKNIGRSFKQLAKDGNSRFHILVSIPMNMTHKDAIDQITNLLRKNLLTRLNQNRVRKPLHGKRRRSKPLLFKLKLLMYKCMYPAATLVELGMKVNISPSKVKILANKQSSEEDKGLARRSIALSTSRALLAAEYISERAARDKFPDSRPTPSLGIDWEASRMNLLKAWPNLKG
jgi:hypothetical protein